MKLIEIEAWKKNSLGDADGIRQFFYPEIKAFSDLPETLDFTISTGAVDRDNDTIDPPGWKLDQYKKNPVVLWAHDYSSLPVARAVDTWIESGFGEGNLATAGLKSRAQFTPRDLYEFGHTVYQLYANGYLHAASVGFKPIVVEEQNERNVGAGDWHRGVDFREQELLEWSTVPVPSNPEALIEARAAGININPFKEWAERTLDTWYAEKGIWLPRSKVEGILRIVNTSKIIDLGAIGRTGKDTEGPGKRAPGGANGGQTKDGEEKPYANEHACRLVDPGKFDADTFRRTSRKHDGKEYGVIMGKLTGETTMTEQSYRYAKDVWDAADARTHCTDHDGILFEPASGKGKEMEEKSGRVISAANESKLKQSRDLIDQVLSQLAAEESTPTPDTKSTEVSPKDDIDETSLRLIISETVAAEIRRATGKLD